MVARDEAPWKSHRPCEPCSFQAREAFLLPRVQLGARPRASLSNKDGPRGPENFSLVLADRSSNFCAGRTCRTTYCCCCAGGYSLAHDEGKNCAAGRQRAKRVNLQQSHEVGKLLQIPTLAGLVLMASVTFAVAAAAQQPAPPPLVQPAPAPDVPAEQVVPAPLVVPAEQVAPVELTGLLGHAVVGAGGSELGRIVDLLADGQGRVRAVVVDVGGFIGLGNRKVAVAWSALRFAAGEKGPVISIVIPPDRIKSWADYIAGRPVAILGAPDSGQ